MHTCSPSYFPSLVYKTTPAASIQQTLQTRHVYTHYIKDLGPTQKYHSPKQNMALLCFEKVIYIVMKHTCQSNTDTHIHTYHLAISVLKNSIQFQDSEKPVHTRQALCHHLEIKMQIGFNRPEPNVNLTYYICIFHNRENKPLSR